MRVWLEYVPSPFCQRGATLPHPKLERLIGSAVVDGGLRESLLRSPAEAAAGFDLTEDELGALGSDNVTSLEDLAARVQFWIAKGHQKGWTSSSQCEVCQVAWAASG